nr:immunoglobulin heavy chain junction region [Mus musculus]
CARITTVVNYYAMDYW